MSIKKLLTLFFVLTNVSAYTQDTLPEFSVTGFDENILITWKNAYTKPVETISIQSSYDSLRHFSTIGSVFNPQSEENGYTDYNPPYKRMYYRIFVAFKDGTYLITTPEKPMWVQKEIVTETPVDTLTSEPVDPNAPLPDTKKDDEPTSYRTRKREPWRADPLERNKPDDKTEIKEKEKEVIKYPSKRIYVFASNHVILFLPDAMIKDYSVKFYNAAGTLILELKNLREEYLILEKVYFGRSGWYNFELYDRGMLIEKNKLQILPDKPRSTQSRNRL